jgi:5-oxoprolinase (ATP-hydrolysing) subunit B
VKHRWITDRGLRLESGDDTFILSRVIEEAALPEVETLVPGDGNLLVVLKPGLAPGASLLYLLKNPPQEKVFEAASRQHDIHVAYGGEAGPDLAALAETVGLTILQVIELHSTAEYSVAFLGFQPGFAYLKGTPEQLNVARMGAPRTRVPAGSVALGGGHTGIYPGVSPGGWQLIGRTTEWLFDPARSPPARFAPGDRVRFVPR